MSKIKISSHGIRSALGMSQSEFARAFGISIDTVRNLKGEKYGLLSSFACCLY